MGTHSEVSEAGQIEGTKLLVGPSPRSASASAIVDVTSTTQGLLIPRMTTVQKAAIGTPATGLLVFDTDLNSLEMYNGAAWEPVTIGPGAVTDDALARYDGTSGQLQNSVAVLTDTGVLTGVTQAGIGGAPDASAILDTASTTQGLLPPRMTTTQVGLIASPAEGLLVYDLTVHAWKGYNGTEWVLLG